MFVNFLLCSVYIRIVFPNSNLIYFQLVTLYIRKFGKDYICIINKARNILEHSELPNFWLKYLIFDKLPFAFLCRIRHRTEGEKGFRIKLRPTIEEPGNF